MRLKEDDQNYYDVLMSISNDDAARAELLAIEFDRRQDEFQEDLAKHYEAWSERGLPQSMNPYNVIGDVSLEAIKDLLKPGEVIITKTDEPGVHALSDLRKGDWFIAPTKGKALLRFGLKKGRINEELGQGMVKERDGVFYRLIGEGIPSTPPIKKVSDLPFKNLGTGLTPGRKLRKTTREGDVSEYTIPRVDKRPFYESIGSPRPEVRKRLNKDKKAKMADGSLLEYI